MTTWTDANDNDEVDDDEVSIPFLHLPTSRTNVITVSRSKSTLLDPSGHVAPLLGIRNDILDSSLVIVGGVGGVGGRCAGDGAIPMMGAVRS